MSWLPNCSRALGSISTPAGAARRRCCPRGLEFKALPHLTAGDMALIAASEFSINDVSHVFGVPA
jgi:hypothetical protein